MAFRAFCDARIKWLNVEINTYVKWRGVTASSLFDRPNPLDDLSVSHRLTFTNSSFDDNNVVWSVFQNEGDESSMNLIGLVPTIFRVDERISNRIVPLTDVENLSEGFLENFTIATYLICEHPDFTRIRTRGVTAIFTKKDTISIDLTGAVGYQTNLIIYKCHEFEGNIQAAQITVFVEELVHHFWDLSDEEETKRIVVQALKKEYPNARYANGHFEWS